MMQVGVSLLAHLLQPRHATTTAAVNLQQQLIVLLPELTLMQHVCQ
jgi:hypothetical protein